MSREDKVELKAGLDVHLGPITINIHNQPPQKDELEFIFGPEYDLPRLSKSPNLEGFMATYQLSDAKGLKLKLSGKSKHGNPVVFKNEDIDTKSSDESILTVTEEDGFISVEPVGPLGTAQVQVSVPSVLLADGTPLAGVFDIQVVAGAAVSLAFEPAETFDLPDAPATPPATP